MTIYCYNAVAPILGVLHTAPHRETACSSAPVAPLELIWWIFCNQNTN